MCVRNILMKGSFNYLNDRFPYPFIYFQFDPWNPYPFIYLKREKGTPFGRSLDPPRIGHYRENIPPPLPGGYYCTCHLPLKWNLFFFPSAPSGLGQTPCFTGMRRTQPQQSITSTWNTAFDPIKLDWFHLDRLSRSSRLKIDFGSQGKRRSSHEANQLHNHVKV